MAKQPFDPDENDDQESFPVSSQAGSLRRRLSAPEDDEQPDSPAPPPGEPGEHVNPFTIDDLSALDLQTVEGEAIESTARDAQEALRDIEAKMAAVTRELAEGQVNQAQFQAIYTHYAEKKAVIERLLTRSPGSDAWRRAAAEGHTAFLRKRHSALLIGLAVYDNWTGESIQTLGHFDLPDEVMGSLLNSLGQEIDPATLDRPQITQIEGGRWLCTVRGAFTTGVAVFSTEPSTVQLVKQGKAHRDFEQANRPALEAGGFDPAHLHYPQEMLFK